MKEHKTQNLHFHGEKKVFSEHAIASEYVCTFYLADIQKILRMLK